LLNEIYGVLFKDKLKVDKELLKVDNKLLNADNELPKVATIKLNTNEMTKKELIDTLNQVIEQIKHSWDAIPKEFLKSINLEKTLMSHNR